jgi:plastocyanin
MRRHLSLTLSLFLVVATGAVAGVTSAGASTAVVPHVTVKIVPGTSCNTGTSFCFKPRTVSISHGTRVVWVNNSVAPHTVTRCTPAACAGKSGGTGTQPGLGSSTISPGAKYKFLFTGTGTYVYYCSIHGYAVMHGTVKVT